MLTALLIYVAVGAGAGFIGGLLGLGGGLIVVPALAIAFQRQGVSRAVLMHLALGTSLATIVITSIAATWAHHRRGAVRWDVLRRLAPGIVVGALGGAALADSLPGHLLRSAFGVFEILAAAQILFNVMASPHRRLPGWVGLAPVGLVIGAVSSIFGIGGGTLTVPYLVWCNVPVRNAVATSSAAGFPVALAGAIGFVAAGWADPHLPAFSTGYLYWPALAGIGLASMALAPAGARLAHGLPTVMLRRVFALFLAALGVRMLVGSG